MTTIVSVAFCALVIFMTIEFFEASKGKNIALPLFLCKLLWASLPNKRQKLHDR